MGVVFDGLEHFLAADPPILWTVSPTRALLGRVAQSKVHGIQTELGGDLVDHLLGSERSLRRTRCPIGCGTGLIHDYVVAVDRDVRALVRSKDAHASRRDERAGVGASLISQPGLQRLDLAIGRGTNLDPDMRSGRRSGP